MQESQLYHLQFTYRLDPKRLSIVPLDPMYDNGPCQHLIDDDEFVIVVLFFFSPRMIPIVPVHALVPNHNLTF